VTTIAAKPGAPVGGFNHNVKYGPRVYHVQTEDSGLPHAHYITHLFVGGNIVASMKTSYADKVGGGPDLPRLVRSLMEGQHKAMLKRLVTGEFDEMAERLSAQHYYPPGVLADGTHTASYVNTEASAPSQASAHSRAQAKPAPAAAPGPAAAPAPRPAPRPAAPAARPQQPVWQPAPPSASPVAPRTPGQPLPAVTRAPAQPTRPTVPPRMAQVATPAPRAPAPARPAAPTFFSETPVEMPTDDLPTLFAEELISEKSLDEVILAFLSADLEPPK
jgi:hypothetical protein